MPAVRSVLLVVGSAVGTAAIGYGVYGLSQVPPADSAVRAPADRPTTDRPTASGLGAGQPATPFVWPAVRTPPTVPAAQANLADDERVVGVVVHGRPRAYRIQALAKLTGHVVNDLVAGTAVSVTHCDRTGCTRVFTANTGETLPIMTGGYQSGLLLKVGDGFYRQQDGRPIDPRSGPMPLQDLEFREVTWKEWRTAHPTTDVYVADPSPMTRTDAGRLREPKGP
jgi:hypothetical protein